MILSQELWFLILSCLAPDPQHWAKGGEGCLALVNSIFRDLIGNDEFSGLWSQVFPQGWTRQSFCHWTSHQAWNLGQKHYALRVAISQFWNHELPSLPRLSQENLVSVEGYPHLPFHRWVLVIRQIRTKFEPPLQIPVLHLWRLCYSLPIQPTLNSRFRVTWMPTIHLDFKSVKSVLITSDHQDVGMEVKISQDCYHEVKPYIEVKRIRRSERCAASRDPVSSFSWSAGNFHHFDTRHVPSVNYGRDNDENQDWNCFNVIRHRMTDNYSNLAIQYHCQGVKIDLFDGSSGTFRKKNTPFSLPPCFRFHSIDQSSIRIYDEHILQQPNGMLWDPCDYFCLTSPCVWVHPLVLTFNSHKCHPFGRRHDLMSTLSLSRLRSSENESDQQIWKHVYDASNFKTTVTHIVPLWVDANNLVVWLYSEQTPLKQFVIQFEKTIIQS